MSHRNLLLLVGVVLASYACYVRAEQNPYARYVAGGFSIIDRWRVEDVPDQELFNASMNAMVDVLRRHGDEHSEFIDARRQEAFREDFEQEFGGVGLRLRLLGKPPLPTVVGLPEPGTPAAKADIRLADRIAAVDGQAVAGMPLDAVTELVRGPIDSPVNITLERVGVDQPLTVAVSRGIIVVESVLGDVRGPDGRWNYLLSEEPRIGFARIKMFGDKTADELATLLFQFAEADAPLDGMILDVRDDAGGSLDAAVQICDLFLRAGQTIVTIRGRDESVRERFTSSGSGNSTLPLAVLIDRNSASASEIVAACLQDYGRAAIVGERSFGKGTVQRLMRVESGRSLLKLTSATYWRPNGQNIHRMPEDGPGDQWGVVPDQGLEVPLTTDEEYLAWRIYRGRRDLIGDDLDSELAVELNLLDGDVSGDYVDQALQKAVDHLREKLER